MLLHIVRSGKSLLFLILVVFSYCSQQPQYSEISQEEQDSFVGDWKAAGNKFLELRDNGSMVLTSSSEEMVLIWDASGPASYSDVNEQVWEISVFDFDNKVKLSTMRWILPDYPSGTMVICEMEGSMVRLYDSESLFPFEGKWDVGSLAGSDTPLRTIHFTCENELTLYEYTTPGSNECSIDSCTWALHCWPEMIQSGLKYTFELKSRKNARYVGLIYWVFSDKKKTQAECTWVSGWSFVGGRAVKS